MSSPLLTVIIPTYDRPEKLKALVNALQRQRSDAWRLIVVDNHSMVPVRDILPKDVYVVRNPVNIGVAGNFPRCFEIAETDWVWLIGDDDMIDEDAIERVLTTLKCYPDAAIINFGCHGVTDNRSEVHILNGVEEFLKKSDSLRASIWISANIHSRKHYWPWLGLAYRFGNTQSAHYVLLLLSLIKGGVYVQIPSPVCRQTEMTSVSTSQSELMNAVMAVADLPLTKKQRHIYARRMQSETIPFASDLAHCAYHMRVAEDKDEIAFLFFSRWMHWAIIRGSWGLFISTLIARLLLGGLIGRSLILLAVRFRAWLRGTPSTMRPYVPRFYRQV